MNGVRRTAAQTGKYNALSRSSQLLSKSTTWMNPQNDILRHVVLHATKVLQRSETAQSRYEVYS